ncbi:MAG: thiolase domain-containing protein [Anaerolineaceae bacterium]
MSGGGMSDIVITGIGQVPVGEHWDQSLRQLAARAILAAIKDTGGQNPQALFIANALGSALSRQANLGALLTGDCGLEGVEGTTIEAAGASGGAALRTAYLALRSGLVDVALVVGIEKLTDVVGPGVDSALAEMMDTDYEGTLGLTPTTAAALLMQRYMHEYKLGHAAFGEYPLMAYAHAAGNPNALYRKAISRETYEKAEPVCDPLTLYDIAPYADGAAALIVTRRELVSKNFKHTPIRISGSAVVTDRLALHDRQNPLEFVAAGSSIERACRQAGILPKDVDILELDDSFSIYPVLSVEAAGLAKRGKGTEWLKNTGKGKPTFATMGGMKARGNPMAASGVYQAVEAVLQLRGEAGDCQVKGAKKALIQCLGGPAATAAAHVLEKAG